MGVQRVGHLIPPSVFSTLTSPIFLSAWFFTFFSSSRFAGMISLSVVLRSGSEAEEYVRSIGVAAGMALGYQGQR